jgi:hypothetical protein
MVQSGPGRRDRFRNRSDRRPDFSRHLLRLRSEDDGRPEAGHAITLRRRPTSGFPRDPSKSGHKVALEDFVPSAKGWDYLMKDVTPIAGVWVRG